MAPITVRALKAFAYRDHSYNPGDSVTFQHPTEAAIRARRGEVSLDRGYNTSAVEPEPDAQPVRRRRSYRRRDLTAEG